MSLRETLKTLDITLANTLLTIAFLGGLLLTVWEINIYRMTFISPYVPTGIWLGTGLILTLPLNVFLEKYYATKSLFLQLVFNTASWGGILVYAFMALNFYMTSPAAITEKLLIADHGKLAKGKSGCEEPYVDVIYEGEEKQLVFNCGTETEPYRFVRLTIKKGLWGFEVIAAKELLKN